MNGGYKCISFHNKNLTINTEGVTIEGIHNALAENHHKATLFCDLVIDGEKRDDRFCYMSHIENTYVGLLGITPDNETLHITVMPNDLVHLETL